MAVLVRDYECRSFVQELMARGINKNWWSYSVKVSAIWFIFAVTFCCLFQWISVTLIFINLLLFQAANPPVRANVLYLRPEYSVPISEAVKSIFSPYLNKAPVPAAEEEIEVEVSAVKAVADDICPLHTILDRLVLTSTGVLLGRWQVMLHTSFAGLLGHPNKLSEEGNNTAPQIFHELVKKPNNKICEHQDLTRSY